MHQINKYPIILKKNKKFKSKKSHDAVNTHIDNAENDINTLIKQA